MNHPSAAAAYRNEQFENAPPLKILQMLNEGAIRFLRVAAGKEPQDPAFRENVRRAEEIISELRLSLDHGPNPELSANLENLYLFMQRELSRALIDGEKAGIESCIQILGTLLEGWKGVNLAESEGARRLDHAG
jgi:flagellar protein FliS